MELRSVIEDRIESLPKIDREELDLILELPVAQGQCEVQERLQAEVGLMLSDVGSSPGDRMHEAEESPSKLWLSSSPASIVDIVNALNSPPGQNGMMSESPGSSPSPTRQEQSEGNDDELSSSPPRSSSMADNRSSTPSRPDTTPDHLSTREALLHTTRSPVTRSPIDDNVARDPSIDDSPIVMALSVKERKSHLEGSEGPCSTYSQEIEHKPSLAAAENSSSFEANLSRVVNSFGDDRRSSSREAQVSSQLRRDLSKAAGNDDSHDGLAVTRKRKRECAGTSPVSKRPRTSQPRSNIQVVIEVQHQSTPVEADSDMLDCIVVDSRPSTASPNMRSSGTVSKQTSSTPKPSCVAAPVQNDRKQPGRPRNRTSERDSPLPERTTAAHSKKRRASESPANIQEDEESSVSTPPAAKKRRLFQASTTPEESQARSPTGRGILGGLKRILRDIQRAVLGSQEEREIDDVLFEIRKEVHQAGRRGLD